MTRLIMQCLVWCFGKARIGNVLRTTRRMLSAPFLHLEDILMICDNDKNSYQHQLSQAHCDDFIDLFSEKD